MIDRILNVKQQYLKPFNSMQTNELWLVYLQTIHSKIIYLSLAFHPYHPLRPAGLLDILCTYRAVVGKFLLVGQH